MQALKVRQQVIDGEINLKVPKEFGTLVEVIILGHFDDKVELWHDTEIKDADKSIKPISETERLQFEGEQAAGADYFRFELENNCVPPAEELEYYNRIVSNATR